MALEISSALLARIMAEAEAVPGEEVCGLLTASSVAGGAAIGSGCRDEPGTTVVAEVRSCRNVAADPWRRFEIDPAALLAAYREARRGGPAIVGCYHSHPGGSPEPSPRDAADAAPDGRFWLIVGSGEVKAWRAVAEGAVHGRFDPVALHVAG